jgi:hypothetical protein
MCMSRGLSCLSLELCAYVVAHIDFRCNCGSVH